MMGVQIREVSLYIIAYAEV